MIKDGNVLQYGLWGACSNNCAFCTSKMRKKNDKQKMLSTINFIKKNIEHIDWKRQFSYGISLLGGEIFFITDREIQNEFLSLIDVIIEKILKVSPNPLCRFSTVTNGLYKPTFLFKVLDKIADSVGTKYIDVNVSYDLKYRFKNEEDRLKVIKLINTLHKRYDYKVGVQMILTQYVIDMVNSGQFDINSFLDNDIPGNTLTFLYPHEINSGQTLDDFQFKRQDFLNFITWLYGYNVDVARQTIYSVFNSGHFKWTGFYHKEQTDNYSQQPELTDGKEIIMDCGHSIIYKCYADSKSCLVCDLQNLDLVR